MAFDRFFPYIEKMDVNLESEQRLDDAPLARLLRLLDAIIADDGARPLTQVGRDIGLPSATAYRLAATLAQQGLLIGGVPGRYLPGPRLVDYASAVDPRRIVARVARPMLDRLARRFHRDAHLGVLEGGMVTYMVKAGGGAATGFARQGMQLEAYCSGVGKALLAHLSTEELDDYLANGPFIRLTANTIVAPDLLREHLAEVAVVGHAVDDEEVEEGLHCLAVPVRDHRDRVIAAISLSGSGQPLQGRRRAAALHALAATAASMHERLSPAG